MIQKIEKKPIDALNPILDALPDNLKKIILSITPTILKDLEEIRIRQDRPLMVYSRGRDYFLCRNGRLTHHADNAYIVSQDDIRRTLELISSYSIYAFEEELRNGYITLQGGYRVGISGKVVLGKEGIISFRHITSFNIRIAREILNVANKVLPFIIENGQVLHTLILSPPQMGKTTLLRDICRQLSNGFPGFGGVKIGIVDERSEIAGCFQGIPQNDVGVRTDILDGCPKAIGIIMMIRSMSPNVIITDEIGKPEDVMAIEDALNAGIKIITSAHSSGLDDARRRPILKSLIDKNIFQRILVLGNSLGTGTLERVYDGIDWSILLDHPVR
ncbi:MAG: stage III sporulation protein AA [Caldicoprobacterales bacterium]|jgi:stage III sporulation protein AA|nr:stage III sporulation protein AA [Clostridiales bacterium]